MPRSPSAKTQQKNLLKHSYNSMLSVVKDGRPVIDPRTGQQARNDKGELIFTPPTAADVNAAGRMARELEGAVEDERQTELHDRARIQTLLKTWKPDEHQLKRVLLARGWSMDDAVKILRGPSEEDQDDDD